MFPHAPCHRGILRSPWYIRYAAGSTEEKRAGGPLPGDTIAQSFLFCNGGEGSPWTDGLILACALLQGRDWLGLRRYPARSALRRFPEQGDSLYPRRGLRPLHPAWEVVARLHTVMLAMIAPPWHCREIILRLQRMQRNRKVSFFSRGSGLACAAIPPAPPSDVFQDREAPPVPRLGGWRGGVS